MKIFHKIIIGIGAVCVAALVTFSAHAFSGSWKPQAVLEKTDNIGLQEKIVIDFSFPVIEDFEFVHLLFFSFVCFYCHLKTYCGPSSETIQSPE